MFGMTRLAAVAVGAAALIGFLPTNAAAQSSVSSQITMEPSGRAPFVTQDAPTVLSPEEAQRRVEAVQRTNRRHEPVPDQPGLGFVRRSPEMPPTGVRAGTPRTLPPSGPASGPQPGSPQEAGNAPGDMVYYLTHDQAAFSGAQKIQINEPSVGTNSNVVFVSSNIDAAYSTDRGNTFTYVNPFTTFPSIDGGMCCDQTVIYDRTTGTMIWQLQYNFSATTQRNTYRVAFAPAASVASAGWCWYDFNPQAMGHPAGANFDYPDIALTNSFVYITARVFFSSGGPGTQVWRIPLAAASQCQSLTYNHIFYADAFTFSLAQGATNTMYWFRHISTSQERLFTWPDSSGTISWQDVNVTTWFDANRSCPGPDGLNWCARVNGSTIGRTSWVAGGVIGTMWSSSQGTNRPYPFIRVARFNESTKALINEPDVWNASFAFIYPSVNVNDRGHLGGIFFYGGGSLYPTLTTLIWDDFSAPPPGWESYNVIASSAGDTTWGDYTSTRRHGASPNTWVGVGQYKPSAGAVRTYYVWFGRERDQPPFNDYFPNATFVSAGGIGSGSNVNATKEEGEPNHFSSGGRSIWYRLTPTRSGPMTVTTNGSSFDTLLAAYSGSSVAGLTQLAADDDCPELGLGNKSCIAFYARTGTTFRIAVDGFSAASGSVQLNLGTIGIPSAHDFSGEGRSDLAWRDTSGTTAVWLMDGATVTSSGGFGAVPTSWRLVGQRDFNGDGNSDWLWRDTSGNTAIWLLNGTSFVSSGFVGNVPANWAIVSTSDFNGDGRGDLLWRDTSGNTAVWIMNGASVSSSGGLGVIPTSWFVAGTADFNGDGRADILWRDTSGNTAMWFMNGTGVASTAFVGNIGTTWSVAATGDFNGDGRADIVWRDGSGNTSIWLMNGATVAASGSLGNIATSWSLPITGDFNGDFKSDLLWRHSSGSTSMWFMNGTAVSSTSFVGNIAPSWSIQGASAN